MPNTIRSGTATPAKKTADPHRQAGAPGCGKNAHHQAQVRNMMMFVKMIRTENLHENIATNIAAGRKYLVDMEDLEEVDPAKREQEAKRLLLNVKNMVRRAIAFAMAPDAKCINKRTLRQINQAVVIAFKEQNRNEQVVLKYDSADMLARDKDKTRADKRQSQELLAQKQRREQHLAAIPVHQERRTEALLEVRREQLEKLDTPPEVED